MSLPAAQPVRLGPEGQNHSNPVLMPLLGLEALAWLLFCPSIWRDRLSGMVEGLTPDFTLANLSPKAWRNPGLRHLILISYIFNPFFISLLILTIRWLRGDTAENIAYATGFSLAGGVAAALLLGLTISAAAGVVAAAAMALACGMDDGVPIRFALSLAFSTIAGVTAFTTTQGRQSTLGQRLGGAVLGLLISAGMIVGGGVLMAALRQFFAFDLAYGLGFGVIAGTALGLSTGRRYRAASLFAGIVFSEAVGVGYGLAFSQVRVNGVVPGVASGLMCGALGGMANALLFSALFAPSYRLARHVAGEWEGAVAASLGSGGAYLLYSAILGTFPSRAAWILGPTSLVLGLTLQWWRPILFFPIEAAWGLLLLRSDERGPSSGLPWLFWHAAFWDEFQFLHFAGLDDHLVLVSERDLDVGEKAIRYLINGPQRWAALRARVILQARAAGRVRDLAEITPIVAQLPVGDKGYLALIVRLQKMIEPICESQSLWKNAPSFVIQEAYARLLLVEVENFRLQLQGFPEPLTSEFRTAVEHWERVAQRQLQDTRDHLVHEPLPLVFHAGNEIHMDREAFVERKGVLGNLLQDLTAPSSPAGVILYGRRRTGKSSVLWNLDSFLPSREYRTAVVKMDEARAFTSLSHFVPYLAEQIDKTWDDRLKARLNTPDLPGLSVFLADCDRLLGNDDRQLIIAIDEYEIIDDSIGKRALPEELLITIRHSIQSHRRLAWIFAGSHALAEMRYAKWTSHLISTKTIEVPMFTPSETHALLTDPMKHSPIWPKEDPSRDHVRFTHLWDGPEGVERVHKEAGGWPYLVQAIARRILELLNKAGSHSIDASLWERALDDVVFDNDTILRHIIKNDQTSNNEWKYLLRFRSCDTQPPPDDDEIAESIRRRLLIAEESGAWRLRVPVMERWLRKVYRGP